MSRTWVIGELTADGGLARISTELATLARNLHEQGGPEPAGIVVAADPLRAAGELAAYLLRNVAARDRLLVQIREALCPDGVVVVHDYSVRDSRIARLTWHAVCWGVVIPLGRITAPRSPIYRYLWRSVLDFDGVHRLADRMVAAGLVDVESRSVSGWQRGTVHTWRGRRAAR